MGVGTHDTQRLLHEQIHYRHSKKGEKEDDYSTEGYDNPFSHLDYGG